MRETSQGLIVFQINDKDDNYDMDKIKETIIASRISKLPIVSKQSNRLIGMACRADIIDMQSFPNASVHPKTKQLLVGGAISTGDGYQKRVDMLSSAGVDVIVIDASQGCSQYQINCLLYCLL